MYTRLQLLLNDEIRKAANSKASQIIMDVGSWAPPQDCGTHVMVGKEWADKLYLELIQKDIDANNQRTAERKAAAQKKHCRTCTCKG